MCSIGLSLDTWSLAQPKYLSPLLGELVSGCRIHPEHHALAAATLPRFLELARPAAVRAKGLQPFSSALAAVLAGCTSLRVLAFQYGLLLSVWPPNLVDLTLELADRPQIGASRLVGSLRSLPRLTGLALRGSGVLVGVLLAAEGPRLDCPAQAACALRERV